MSLATEKIPIVKVQDSRLDLGSWRFPVKVGGQNVAYLRQQADSLGSTTSFTITPPNPGGSILSPKMLWHNKVTFSIAVPAGGTGDLIQAGVFDAPRAYPLTSCVDSATIQVNNESVSYGNWAQIAAALRRFNARNLYRDGNFCPWFPDQSSTYEALCNSLRDPLSAAGSTGDVDFYRGAYARFYTTAVNATSATVVLETYEPLTFPPLLWSDDRGIPYVQNLKVTFNISNFVRALSHSVPSGVTFQIPDNAIMATHNLSEILYASVASNLLEAPIPRLVQLPLYRTMVNTTQGSIPQSVPALGTQVAGAPLQSNIISYPCVPSRIYVFAVPNPITNTANTPDFVAQYCGNLDVQWNSRTAVMSSITPEQLYQNAVEAGCILPWEQWSGVFRYSAAAGTAASAVGGVGSHIVLRPGIDFALDPAESVGKIGQYQFQVRANFNCQRGGAASVAATLYVVAVLPSVLSLDDSFTSRIETGVVSTQDVLKVTEQVSHEEVEGGAMTYLSDMKPLRMKGKGVTTGGSAYSGGAAREGSMFGGAMLPKKSLKERLY